MASDARSSLDFSDPCPRCGAPMRVHYASPPSPDVPQQETRRTCSAGCSPDDVGYVAGEGSERESDS